MSFWRRLSAWWKQDDVKRAEEASLLKTEHERDVAEEDFEAQRDDVASRSEFLAGGVADYERDSEKPQPPLDRPG
jgi:hypothetical protein